MSRDPDPVPPPGGAGAGHDGDGAAGSSSPVDSRSASRAVGVAARSVPARRFRSVAQAGGEGVPVVAEDGEDRLAVEEPLEIVLVAGDERRLLALTMRTPPVAGAVDADPSADTDTDAELAAGFLHGEGVVRDRDLLVAVESHRGSDGATDRVEVHLAARRLPQVARLERHVFTTGACGVCGRPSLDGLLAGCPAPPQDGPRVRPEVLLSLPRTLRAAQPTFAATGGLHAAALFDLDGRLLAAREDVGRHNALDKLLGAELLAGRLAPETPLADRIVAVSGRASFELVQKCAAAGVPVLAAVSAPSTLAVEVAEAMGTTLVAFLRDGRFTVYAGGGRVG